jgi:hypothetical protein
MSSIKKDKFAYRTDLYIKLKILNTDIKHFMEYSKSPSHPF